MQLTRYPEIATTIASSVTLYLLSNPTAEYSTQSYVVGTEFLTILIDFFTVTPSSDSISITYTVTLSDGSTLPSFITYVETDSTSTIDIKVVSYDNLISGNYDLMISGTATHTN